MREGVKKRVIFDAQAFIKQPQTHLILPQQTERWIDGQRQWQQREKELLSEDSPQPLSALIKDEDVQKFFLLSGEHVKHWLLQLAWHVV